MAIKEVISYNKDLITGEVHKEVKTKEAKGIKGKVLIELFNAKTKEKVKEAYTENIIPDLIFKDIFLRYFSGDVLGIGNTNHHNTTTLFSHIYLTDSTKPESPNTERVVGNIIGYAQRGSTYSGVDPQRGTINLSETSMEIRNNKVRVNYVFDFPTHAANGTFESIFWSDSLNGLHDHYMGPPVCGKSRTAATGYLNATNTSTVDEIKAIYWGILHVFNNMTRVIFTDYHKGYVLFSGSDTNATNSSFVQFPEHLKGHQIIFPFDINMLSTGFLDFSKGIALLDELGEPLPWHMISGAVPVLKDNGEIDYIVGFYRSSNRLTLYKWSSVGVLLSNATIENMATEFQDEYSTNFNYRNVFLVPAFWGEPIELYGNHSRTDQTTNEIIYNNRLIRLNLDGTVHSEVDVKPRIGTSMWFMQNGMNSGNIERRCHLNGFVHRTKTRIYLRYNGVNGGSSFVQVITPEGNIVEPYRPIVDTGPFYNLINTDKWVYMYRYTHSSTATIGFHYSALSKPCGAHTKLASPVEKTDANTMKVQYMFEIDLIDYLNDRY
ncbi:hypothetical protein EDC18_10549 [Natranaerovirga pectinivora]|uniref:Uncharacterized protein n=1 Tax=Natranaerovirga pectinivora TaxID=682400 RepID=A0A4R3ML38_9FIRM|nr:hypothetical protein [Natranaerovirga pectinivora]TCT14568.1 hypothetical protein EDC18_10549 [Natranaerovirga pectinivora]